MSGAAPARGFSLGLAAVVALALGLRLAWLRQDSTFQRTDEVMFLLNAARLHALVAPASVTEAVREAFWAFAFPWGYPVVFALWGLLEVYRLAGIPVTEFTAIAPFAALGALAPALVGWLGARLFSRPVALAAALALAVTPAHVAQSRTIAAWILASNLQMLVVLGFLRYVQTQRARDAWLLSLALALYVPADNLFPGTAALLVMLALAAGAGGLPARVRKAWCLLARREVLLLPAVTAAPLVAAHLVFVATGRGTYGFIGHYFLGKAGPGLHAGDLVRGLAANGGAALALLMAVGAIRGALALARRDRALAPALWLLAFAVPAALIIDPAATTLRGYLTPVVIPLLLLGAAGLAEVGAWLARRPWCRWSARLPLATVGLAAAWTLATIPGRVYDADFLGFPREPIGLWGGEIYPNDGAKTAGWFIRRETPDDALVLSDVRPLVGKYYFHRRTLHPGAGTGAADVLALTAAGREKADLTGWSPAATVTHAGREVFFVYTREPRPSVRLSTEEHDRRFDREFGRVDRLRYPVVWGD